MYTILIILTAYMLIRLFKMIKELIKEGVLWVDIL